MEKIKIVIAIIIVITLAITSIYIFNNEKNINGFKIKNNELISYTGTEKEVTVPKEVEIIGQDAFSSDMGNGENLEKVTINNNVKLIKTNAFAFTHAKTIIINEGVKEIEYNAFSDSYISEIYFPSSVEKIGNSIMETEEGLNNTKIHVKKGSKIDEYFKNNKPYGTVKIIYE